MICPVCNDQGEVLIRVYRDFRDLPLGSWVRRPCSAPSCYAGRVVRFVLGGTE